jgi:hypothetical protein
MKRGCAVDTIRGNMATAQVVGVREARLREKDIIDPENI